MVGPVVGSLILGLLIWRLARAVHYWRAKDVGAVNRVGNLIILCILVAATVAWAVLLVQGRA